MLFLKKIILLKRTLIVIEYFFGGFMKLVKLAVPLLLLSAQVTFSQTLDVLRGNTDAPGAKLSQVDKVVSKVEGVLSRKCTAEGCVLYVNEGEGNEFRVALNVGEGNSVTGGTGGTGINIYNGTTEGQYYGISLSYSRSNFTCRFLVPESVARFVEMYVNLISTKEFAAKVLRKAEIGEDMPMPEPIKLAFMTLATLKPAQGNCGVSTNSYGR
jgi:hypothetical protein